MELLLMDLELAAVARASLVRSHLQVLEKSRNVDRRRVSWPELA